MKLYKYVSTQTLLKILQSNKVYCAPISSFNDPFEGQVFQRSEAFSQDDFIEEVCRQIVEMQETGEKVHLESIAEQNPIAMHVALFQVGEKDFTPIDRLLEKLREFLVTHGVRSGPSPWARNVHKKTADYVHAFCLTENPNNLVMWAHYADNHRGAVLGFDMTGDPTFLATANKVVYRSDFPERECLQENVRTILGRGFDSDRWITETFLTKSLEWAYESEWRVLVRKKMLDQNYLVPFFRTALREVILGCRCSRSDRATLIDICREIGPHVALSEAEIDHGRFAVNYVSIDLQ